MVHLAGCCMSANRKAERDEGDINDDINYGGSCPAPSLAKARMPVATWECRGAALWFPLLARLFWGHLVAGSRTLDVRLACSLTDE